MYSSVAPDGMSDEQAIDMYAAFLRNSERFELAIARVFSEWPLSCENFLTNISNNRIAWIGQSSMCIETGIPCRFRAGFKRLSQEDQKMANSVAAKWLRRWERQHAQKDRNLRQAMGKAMLSERTARRSPIGNPECESSAVIQGHLYGDLEE